MTSKFHRRWSHEDTIKARQMLERDASDAEFMAIFDRSKKAAQARIRSVDFPRNRSGEIRDRTMERLRYERSGIHVTSRGAKIPDEVLADRERRQLALRTVTAFVFGDPAPGQSALDKRQEIV